MPPIELTSALNIILMVFVAVGMVLIYRGNRGKALTEVQQSTIDAQQAQIDTQEKQIKALEKKIVYLNRVVQTVEYALKRRGLRIEISDEAITLIDEQSRSNQTVQIRMMEAMHHQDEDRDA